MKILKAIGNFILAHANHISAGLFLVILAISSAVFWKEPTLQNGVFMIGWLILTLGQGLLLALNGVRNTQHDIQREMAKLRHPSQMFLVDMPRLTADHHERIAKIKNLFPEPKNRDAINEGLRQQFRLYEYPKGGFLNTSIIKTPDTERIYSQQEVADWAKTGVFKETRDGEAEQDRTIADPPADEMREPFNWGPGKSRIVDIPTKEELEADLKDEKTGGSRFA